MACCAALGGQSMQAAQAVVPRGAAGGHVDDDGVFLPGGRGGRLAQARADLFQDGGVARLALEGPPVRGAGGVGGEELNARLVRCTCQITEPTWNDRPIGRYRLLSQYRDG